MTFKSEIEHFKKWASTQHQSHEWELEYPNWSSFEAAFFAFLSGTKHVQWDEQDWHDIIFAVARDNECENFISEISEDQGLLKELAQRAVKSDERDTKWQVAEYLGQSSKLELTEPILLELVADVDEYVARRALAALSILQSKETERLAISAWDTGQLYQRIGALHALYEIGSSELEHYLKLAQLDGRDHLVNNASELHAKRKIQS